MAGHLAATGSGVSVRPYRLQEQLGRCDTEGEGQGPVPVIGEKPVITGPQRPGKPKAKRFMAGARNMKKTTALLLQSYLAVVEVTRNEGQPVIGEDLRYC